MIDDDNDFQTVRFEIENSRLSYGISGSEDPAGFEEGLSLMLKVRTTEDIPGNTSMGVIHIKGDRDVEQVMMRPSGDHRLIGIGLVKATAEGLLVQSIMPFDAAFHIAGAVKAGQIGIAFVEFDPIRKVGDRAFLRELRLAPA